jgi:hypothetical protein
LVVVSATQELLRFGIFELNLATEELRKSGTPVKLPPLPFKLLALLASHAGQIVTRQEIQEKLWGAETFVDFEQGVNKCIKQIRTALNDNADIDWRKSGDARVGQGTGAKLSGGCARCGGASRATTRGRRYSPVALAALANSAYLDRLAVRTGWLDRRGALFA